MNGEAVTRLPVSADDTTFLKSELLALLAGTSVLSANCIRFQLLNRLLHRWSLCRSVSTYPNVQSRARIDNSFANPLTRVTLETENVRQEACARVSVPPNRHPLHHAVRVPAYEVVQLV